MQQWLPLPDSLRLSALVLTTGSVSTSSPPLALRDVTVETTDEPSATGHFIATPTTLPPTSSIFGSDRSSFGQL